MPRRAPFAVLLCVAAMAILAPPATAVPIHRHLTLHLEQRIPDTGETAAVIRHVTRVVDVAPPYTPPAPAPAVEVSSSVAGPAPTSLSEAPASGGTLAAIKFCESGGSYTAVNPSGAGGAYQMMPSTWAGLGYSGLPQDAPPAEQDAAAAQLYAEQGTGPWIASQSCWG